ncbi:Sorbin and SH3 domain-containing protein 2 [Amphibalanus amphitrite]|uniref:Sorbin and SH3 domain-containing protein 2 n=1 Tax=Amphibalanus amphitrite TaxID=1232801 RepID=A0A6A4WZV3_AMPAM|nr:Sorbin and SH3 domain-containing protein 2 [Amphibalanus amphitrite]
MPRTMPVDTQWQNFWKESIHNETETRMRWALKFDNEFHKMINDPQLADFKVPCDRFNVKKVPTIEHPSTSYVIDKQYHMKKQPPPPPIPKKPDSGVSLDMYPPDPATKALLYDGISYNGEGRYQYLRARNKLPSQKSPIPLNRYDNLFDDVTIRSSRGGEARLAARALHGFKPINNRELCFNKGDIIFIRRQVDRNWLEGELNGRIGIFPVNYVQVVPLDSQRGGRPKLGAEGQARVRYSFTAQTPVELSLKKGDLVTLLRRVDSNWYEGRLGNRTGIFPTTYVEVLGRPLPERIESSAKSPGGGMTGGATSAPGGGLQNQLHVDTTQQEAVPYKALYSYQPQNDDELALTEGDVVYVIEKCEDGWYVGTNGRSAMFGTFPGNYVQRVQ